MNQISKRPCCHHRLAFPTWKMSEVWGMMCYGKYFKRCKRCNWVITTRKSYDIYKPRVKI